MVLTDTSKLFLWIHGFNLFLFYPVDLTMFISLIFSWCSSTSLMWNVHSKHSPHSLCPRHDRLCVPMVSHCPGSPYHQLHRSQYHIYLWCAGPQKNGHDNSVTFAQSCDCVGSGNKYYTCLWENGPFYKKVIWFDKLYLFDVFWFSWCFTTHVQTFVLSLIRKIDYTSLVAVQILLLRCSLFSCG